MSGYAAIISADQGPPDCALLDRMAAALAFRGPDATHITTQPGAGFVFTFLKTGPAPQSPQQPCTVDGRVWLIGDVRLDGRDDLRRKLEQHGASLPSTVTDEELILHAWQKWGEQSFPDLIGDYAFALWDSPARRLRCLRDLIGSRPFFYAHVAGQLIFSNTLNVIRLAPQVSAELDRHFIGDFLLEGWCPDLARSAFRDIARLPPGHVLSYKEGAVTVRRFTSFHIEEPLLLKRPEEYVERFRALLDQAVADRLPQGPVSIFMSGGLDSTSVAAIALNSAKKRVVPLDLRAYVVDYNPLFDDSEGALARQAARHFNIPIEVQSAASHLPYFNWDDLASWMPEPLHEPFRSVSVTAIRYLAERARVFLTGYGGDGIMTGQSWPYLVYLFRRRQFRTLGKSFGGYLLRHGRLPPFRGGFRVKLRRWMHRDSDVSYPPWLAPSFERDWDLGHRWHRLQQSTSDLHPWHPSGYAAIVSPAWPSTLETHDAAWYRVPVEGRSALLDLRIQSFLLRVPPVPYCVDKLLLRRSVDGVLPNQIRLREKTPLRRDPLAIYLQTRVWSPPQIPDAGLHMGEFVDCDNFRSMLDNPLVRSPWRDLRPLSLFYWMKGIANAETG